MTTLLREVRAPQSFGLLSVDTEGLDEAVLKGLDMVEFRPSVVITETDSKVLASSGYTPFSRLGCNTVWKDRGDAG